MSKDGNPAAPPPACGAAGLTENPALSNDNQIHPNAVPSNQLPEIEEIKAPLDTVKQGAPSDSTPSGIVPVNNPVYVTPLDRLGELPAYIDCPYCKKRTQTKVSHEDSTATTLAGGICCLLTCIGTCIPCLCGWCQDTNHNCSQCNHRIAHKPHDGPVQVINPPSSNVVPSKYAYASPTEQMDAKGTSKAA